MSNQIGSDGVRSDRSARVGVGQGGHAGTPGPETKGGAESAARAVAQNRRRRQHRLGRRQSS